MKVSDFVAKFIEDQQLSHVFGVSGANIEDLFFALQQKTEVKTVLAKTEYQAAMMAIGAYLCSHKVHAVLTTSGPGVLNTLPVLAEAFSSHLPIVLIAGDIPENLQGSGGFQDGSGKNGSLNLSQMIQPAVGFFCKVSKQIEILPALSQAFVSALENKNPSAVFFAKNIFNEQFEPTVENSVGNAEINHTSKVETVFLNKKNEIQWQQLEKIKVLAEELQKKSISPLMILGENLVHLKNLDGIYTLIENLNAAVAAVPVAKGLYNNRSARFLGLTGIMGHESVNEYLRKVDTVLVLGSSLDHLSRFSLDQELTKKNIIWIDLFDNKQFLRSERQTVLEGDIEYIVDQINLHLQRKDDDKLSDSKVKRASDNKNLISPSKDEQTIFNTHDHSQLNFKNCMDCLSQAISKDDQLFIDAGNVGAFVLHHLVLNTQHLCYVSLGMGGMGNSIGAALGASCVSGQRSFVILGDGSFLMYGLEIHTAVEKQLPIVFIIFNNDSHGMCVTRENVFLGQETELNKFKHSQYALGVGQMFPGLSAYEVNSFSEFVQSLQGLEKSKGPVVISINLQSEEAPPFKSFYKK